MSYAEKQELTELLGELPEDKQARVVQIVAERHAEMGGAEDDLIEINIEELDSVTLWKLDRYVRSCLKPKKKKPTQADMLLEAQRLEAEAERELMQVEASLGRRRRPAPSCRSSAGATGGADGGLAAAATRLERATRTATHDSAAAAARTPRGGGGGAGPPWRRRRRRRAEWRRAGGGFQRPRRRRRGSQNASKAPVTVQNQAGWANLADKTAAAKEGGEAGAAGGAAAIPDALWNDRAMAQRKSEREKGGRRRAARAAAEAKETAALAEEQRKRRDRGAGRRPRRAEEEAEAAKARRRGERRRARGSTPRRRWTWRAAQAMKVRGYDARRRSFVGHLRLDFSETRRRANERGAPLEASVLTSAEATGSRRAMTKTKKNEIETASGTIVDV